MIGDLTTHYLLLILWTVVFARSVHTQMASGG
jgi:hypothetical protein